MNISATLLTNTITDCIYYTYLVNLQPDTEQHL